MKISLWLIIVLFPGKLVFADDDQNLTSGNPSNVITTESETKSEDKKAEDKKEDAADSQASEAKKETTPVSDKAEKIAPSSSEKEKNEAKRLQPHEMPQTISPGSDRDKRREERRRVMIERLRNASSPPNYQGVPYRKEYPRDRFSPYKPIETKQKDHDGAIYNDHHGSPKDSNPARVTSPPPRVIVVQPPKTEKIIVVEPSKNHNLTPSQPRVIVIQPSQNSSGMDSTRPSYLEAKQFRDRELRERELRLRELRLRELELRDRELRLTEKERALREKEWYDKKLQIREWQNMVTRDEELRYLIWRENQLRRYTWRERDEICHYVTYYQKGVKINKRVTICERRNGMLVCHHPRRYYIYPITKIVCYPVNRPRITIIRHY